MWDEVAGATTIGLLLVSCLGCTPRDPFLPGLSEEPLPSGPASAGKPPPAMKWDHREQIGKLEVLVPTFVSRGHGTGSWNAELRGSAGAGVRLDTLVRGEKMKEGTLLVQRHTQLLTGAELGSFAMEKKASGYFSEGGDWEYVVVGRDGRVVARGKLQMCARCHAEAPSDFVFPRRREEPATKDD